MKMKNEDSYVLLLLAFSMALSMIFTLFIPGVNASDIQSLGQIKFGDDILLKQNCVNITYANITSISVNGLQTIELILSSIAMNQISNGYQTYNFTNSSYLGEYIVTGICDENGIAKAWSYNYLVSPAGTTLSVVQISIYIFFLLLCLVVTFFSIRLFKQNRMSKDFVTGEALYQTRKRNEFFYYMEVLKKHFWIVGVFGVYLSILVFMALLDQLVYNLGLSDLDNILQYVVLLLSWGLIPFTIFWFVWLIIIFYKTTTDTMKFQFGNIASRRQK